MSGAELRLRGRSTVFDTKGIGACEHPLAALTEIRLLGSSGNAANARVTMAAPLLTRSDDDRHGRRLLLFYKAETVYAQGES